MACKWIKRRCFALMILAVMLMSLTACGGSESGNEGQKTITFSHWGGEETYSGAYEERVAEFERQNPDIKVEIITVAEGYDTKIQTMMVGGEAPDVIQLAEALPQYAMRDQLLDLSEYISEAGMNLERNWGDSVSQYQVNGGTYGLPDRGGPMILYYNKDLFDGAGLDYPDENWTVDDMLNALEALTIVEDGETIQWGGSWLDWIPQWAVEIKGNGGSFIKEGEIVINSSENLAALERVNQNYQNGYMVPYEEIESVNINHFAQGKVGIVITGFWDVSSFSRLDDLNFDIAPVWQGVKESVTWPFGSALTISKDSKYPEEAWKFIEFMTGYEAQSMMGDSMGDCPAHLEVLSSDQFINRQVNGKDINLDVIAISSERVVIDEIFQGPYYDEVASAGSDLIKEMLLGRLTPQEALDELESRMETIVADY